MPSRVHLIAVHLACAGMLTAGVARPASAQQAKPEGVQSEQPDLPKTFTTPGKVKATVVSSSRERLTINAVAPSGATSTIHIVGETTVMAKGMVETLIDIGIAILGTFADGGKAPGKCTQTMTTVISGGTTTMTIKTECTAPK
jgi:hypothetical protein